MEYCPVDKSIADALIAAHDGDMALLWLYLARHGAGDLEQAARELCRTYAEVSAAYEKLQRLGLTELTARGGQAASIQVQPPAEELPEYETADLVRRSKEDEGFAVTVAEAQKALGHVLSSSDLKRLFGIYDYLALPPEVILMLLNHCVDISKGRRPSMRFIEKEAYVWANREILSLEQAEEYIQRCRARRDDTGRMKALLGINGRELTNTEQKYINAWLDMGFDEDCINIALDRTVTNTGSLKWSYMNKILQSWQEKGIRTGRDVQEKDSRRKAAAPAKPGQDRPIDLDKLKSLMNKM